MSVDKADKKEKKRPYEKPAIIFEEKIEAVAGACGAFGNEKTDGGSNPTYHEPCRDIHS